MTSNMEEAKASALSFGRGRDRDARKGREQNSADFFIPVSRTGQSDAEAAKMTERYGANTLTEKKRKGRKI